MDEQKKQDEQKPFVGAVSVSSIKTEKYTTNGKKIRR